MGGRDGVILQRWEGQHIYRLTKVALVKEEDEDELTFRHRLSEVWVAPGDSVGGLLVGHFRLDEFKLGTHE